MDSVPDEIWDIMNSNVRKGSANDSSSFSVTPPEKSIGRASTGIEEDTEDSRIVDDSVLST
jgi:hypothetical protein